MLYDGWGKVGCSVDGCDLPHNAKGLCRRHYGRLCKYGDPLGSRPFHRGPPKPPLGTRRTIENGYVHVYDPEHPNAHRTGWVPEHRKVVGEHLGRPLYDDELVHHKNGDRADNRLANLELCVRRQPPGQRVADLLPWARELVARYDGKLFV